MSAHSEFAARRAKASALAAILWRTRCLPSETPEQVAECVARMSDELWLHTDAVYVAARGLKREPGVPSADTKRLVIGHLRMLTPGEFDWIDELAPESAERRTA